VANNISGTGTVRQDVVGAGTTILTGANTYSGTTTIDTGAVFVNGAHTGAGAYAVGVGGTLGGSGSISTAGDAGVTILGQLAPGASIGTLQMDLGAGVLDISGIGAGSLLFELGATGDQVLLAGSSVLNIGTLDFSD